MRNQHGVFLNLDVANLRVKSKDVVFLVYRGNGRASKKFGDLRVSQGAVVWRGQNDKKGRKLRWAAFDKLMQEFAGRSERRKPRDVRSVPSSKRRV